jgi:hypothetical protein
MGIDETGKDYCSARVDDTVSPSFDARCDLHDVLTGYEQVTARDIADRGVNRNDAGIPEENARH